MSDHVRDSLSWAQKLGVFMFMLGTVPILATSVSTTLILMNIHGEPSQPAPVVSDVLAGTVLLATAGAITFGIACVGWRGARETAVEVLSR